MPAGDRTGPRGEGPRTGRGFGKCNQGFEEVQGVVGRGRGGVPRGGDGRGFSGGPGRGPGRGWRRAANFNRHTWDG